MNEPIGVCLQLLQGSPIPVCLSLHDVIGWVPAKSDPNTLPTKPAAKQFVLNTLEWTLDDYGRV